MVNGQSGRNIRNVTKVNAVTGQQVVVEVATIQHQPTVETNVLVVYMNVKDVFLKQIDVSSFGVIGPIGVTA